MDDFDFTYDERSYAFVEGQSHGEVNAKEQSLEDIQMEAQQFGTEFAEELAIYHAYITVYEQLNIQAQLPLLKANDIVQELKTTMKSVNYTSLQELKQQREQLRRNFQILKAMLAIHRTQKRQKQSLDF